MLAVRAEGNAIGTIEAVDAIYVFPKIFDISQ
jgi:hypothetical protein